MKPGKVRATTPQEWARLRHGIGDRPVVGITGSYAKTSTKMLLSLGLAAHKNVVCNRSSYNLVDGILSTFNRVTSDTDVVVQEIGASGPGSLDGLLVKLLPTVGVLTRVADDHLSAFRNREAVLREKFKMIQALPRQGTAVLNIDDPLIAGMVDRVHCGLLTFGRGEKADLRAVNVSAAWPERLEFDLVHRQEVHRVRTRLIGEHNLVCVLAAISAAEALGVELPGFIQGIGELEGVPLRMQEHRRADGLAVVLDSYKAAYYMMDDAIAFLAKARAKKRCLVVGQLSDTRKKEGRLFRSLARACVRNGIDFITVGEARRRMLRREEYGINEGVGVFESPLEVFQFMNENLSADDLVLIKANTSSRMERIVLAETIEVRCRALSCGRRLHCSRCGEIGKSHPPGYRFDKGAASSAPFRDESAA